MGLEKGQLARPPSADELEVMLIVRGKRAEELASPMPPLTEGMPASSHISLQVRRATSLGQAMQSSSSFPDIGQFYKQGISLKAMWQNLIVSNHSGFSQYFCHPHVGVDFEIHRQSTGVTERTKCFPRGGDKSCRGQSYNHGMVGLEGTSQII